MNINYRFAKHKNSYSIKPYTVLEIQSESTGGIIFIPGITQISTFMLHLREAIASTVNGDAYKYRQLKHIAEDISILVNSENKLEIHSPNVRIVDIRLTTAIQLEEYIHRWICKQ